MTLGEIVVTDLVPLAARGSKSLAPCSKEFVLIYPSLVRMSRLHVGSRVCYRPFGRRSICPKRVMAMDLLDHLAYHWLGVHRHPFFPEA